MLKRERWIVYPLLLLVITISLKDKLNSQRQSLRLKNIMVDQLEVGTIRGGTANFREVGGGMIQTTQINVLDNQGRPKVVLHTAPSIEGNEPDFTKTQGAISLLSDENKQMLILGGSSGGGFVAARSASDPQDVVAFGYQAGRAGVFWLDDNGNPQGLLKPQKGPAGNANRLPGETALPGTTAQDAKDVAAETVEVEEEDR